MTKNSLIIVFFVVSVCSPQELQIQPNQQVIDKEVGGSLALTCRPNVPDPSLVSQLEWRDPLDRKIDSSNRANPVYVQVRCATAFSYRYRISTVTLNL